MGRMMQFCFYLSLPRTLSIDFACSAFGFGFLLSFYIQTDSSSVSPKSVHPSPLTSSSLPSLHVLIFNLSSSSSTSSSAEAMAKEGVSFRLDDSSTGIGRRYARTGVLIKKKRWWTGWGCLIKKKQYVPVCKCHSLALSTRRRDRHSLWRDCGLPVSERPHCDRA